MLKCTTGCCPGSKSWTKPSSGGRSCLHLCCACCAKGYVCMLAAVHCMNRAYSNVRTGTHALNRDKRVSSITNSVGCSLETQRCYTWPTSRFANLVLFRVVCVMLQGCSQLWSDALPSRLRQDLGGTHGTAEPLQGELHATHCPW